MASNDVRIGGDVPADRNVIGGNSSYGVLFTAGTRLVIRGNYIGVGADGTTRVGSQSGIFALNNATDGLWEDNVIAGNFSAQIDIGNLGATGHVVRNNRIGVRADGTTFDSGGSFGININGAPGATLENNLIGGVNEGITIRNSSADDIVVRGNRIGVDPTGTIPLPVVRGIFVAYSTSGSPTNVTIGGVGDGDGNVVANATSGGIVVLSGLSSNVGFTTYPIGIRIRGNSIWGNAGPGIDLEDDGPTPNDPAPDDDIGANGLQNAPVLTSADAMSGVTIVTGELDSTPSTTFDVDFYASPAADPSGFGEGETYLGTVEATTDGAGHAVLATELPAVAPGYVITATATSPTGDTSEFSNAMAVSGPTTTTASTTTTTSSTSTTSSSTAPASTSTTSTTSPASTSTTSTTSTASTSTSSTTTTSTTSTSSSTSSPASTSTSSTTTLGSGSTTTTTLPGCPDTGIPQILCLLDALPPPACDGVALPKPAVRGLTAVRAKLEKAMTAPPKRVRRLARKAAARMGGVSNGLGKAAKRGKLPSDCAADMRTELDAARALTQGLIAQ